MPVSTDKFAIPQRFAGDQRKSVWAEYGQLAAKYKPLNLGMGFSNMPMDESIRKTLEDVAATTEPNLQQYARGFGHPRLVRAIAEMYSPLVGRQLDAFDEVLVTAGAIEGLYIAVQAFVDAGDEVIIIEPLFGTYIPAILAAGGVPRSICLKPPAGGSTAAIPAADWHFDWDEFEALFSGRTKMLILNTPNNPIGKVYTRTELERIAALCRRWNVLCLSDEVYEWLVYDGAEHVRMCTLPGMWERTVTVCSAGKTFSATGWRVGWLYGPQRLVRNLQVVHQSAVYTCNTPVQEAIAMVLERETMLLASQPHKSYLHKLPAQLTRKRDILVEGLCGGGLRVTVPQAGIFVLSDWSALRPDLSGEAADEPADYRFTKWLTREWGLLGIPTTAFFSEQNRSVGEPYARFCYFKDDETLVRAAAVLAKMAAVVPTKDGKSTVEE